MKRLLIVRRLSLSAISLIFVLHLAGCTVAVDPNNNRGSQLPEELTMFLQDLAREAAAAFLL